MIKYINKKPFYKCDGSSCYRVESPLYWYTNQFGEVSMNKPLGWQAVLVKKCRTVLGLH